MGSRCTPYTNLFGEWGRFAIFSANWLNFSLEFKPVDNLCLKRCTADANCKTILPNVYATYDFSVVKWNARTNSKQAALSAANLPESFPLTDSWEISLISVHVGKSIESFARQRSMFRRFECFFLLVRATCMGLNECHKWDGKSVQSSDSLCILFVRTLYQCGHKFQNKTEIAHIVIFIFARHRIE